MEDSLRSLHYLVDEKIVKLGHFLTIGAFYFDFAARMIMSRNRFGQITRK